MTHEKLRFLVYILTNEARGVTLPVEVMDELGLTGEEIAVIEKYIPKALAQLHQYRTPSTGSGEVKYELPKQPYPPLRGAWVSDNDAGTQS